MRDALRDMPNTWVLADEQETFLVTLQLKGQQEIDRCVDALRSRQVSIVSLKHHRLSLEEPFLEVLGIETNQI